MLADVQSQLDKSGVDLGAIEQRLMTMPGYLDAVHSGNEYSRGEMARRFASQNGVEIPAGVTVDGSGHLADANAAGISGTIAKWAPLGIAAAAGGAALLPGAAGGTAAAAPAATSGSYIGSDVASTAASSLGGHSALDTILGTAGKVKGLASVLGGAAKDQAATKAINARNQLDWERLNLDAPGKKESSSLAAALTKNYTPSTLHWSGPGSGLRGETPTYSGGAKGALSAAKNDPAMAKLLQDVLDGKAGIPNPQAPGGAGHESLLDKILGGGALATSIWGAIK